MKTYYPGNLSGNDRRYNRNQNTYDSGLTNKGPGMYRRNNTYRKKSGPDSDAILSEGITAIKDYLKEIADLQKRLVGSQEQIARAQEAHAEAMQQIASCVMLLLGKGADPAPTPVTEDEPTRAAEPEAVREAPIGEVSEKASPEISVAEDTSEEEPLSESTSTIPMVEAAFKIIAEMRKNRVSFEKIADHLDAEGVPPVPGAGKWNRKTVSKFYKEAAV